MKPSISSTKSFHILRIGLALAVLAAPVWAQEQTAAQQDNPKPSHYIVTDLGPVGPPPGQPFVVTTNDFVSGEVILTDALGGLSHAVLWERGSMKDISTPGLGGRNSATFGVNIWGQAVGQADTLTSAPKGEDFCGSAALGLAPSGNTCMPFVWQNGAMSALPTLRDSDGASGNNGQAWQINALGEAVGSSENATADSTCPGPKVSPQAYEFKPVVWFRFFPWAETQIRELPTISGDPDGVAFAVNERGQAVGASGACGPFNPITLINLVPLHAVLWENGMAIDLGNLGGDGQFAGIYASGLNNLGQVVGVSDTTGDAGFHGFLWQKGHITDLGTLPGDFYSSATAISDRGQVVGVSLDVNFNPRAVIWQNGKIANINDLVPADTTLILQTGCSINAEGQIIGIAVAKGTTNDYHAYLATPIYSELGFENTEPAAARRTSESTKTSDGALETLPRSHFSRMAARPTGSQ